MVRRLINPCLPIPEIVLASFQGTAPQTSKLCAGST